MQIFLASDHHVRYDDPASSPSRRSQREGSTPMCQADMPSDVKPVEVIPFERLLQAQQIMLIQPVLKSFSSWEIAALRERLESLQARWRPAPSSTPSRSFHRHSADE